MNSKILKLTGSFNSYSSLYVYSWMNISRKITGKKSSICESSNLMRGDQLGDKDLNGRIIFFFL
jgi:hypothetical protein